MLLLRIDTRYQTKIFYMSIKNIHGIKNKQCLQYYYRVNKQAVSKIASNKLWCATRVIFSWGCNFPLTRLAIS